MFEFWIFVSGGSEVDTERDLAVKVLGSVDFVFTQKLGVSVVIRHWDFRDEPPELVPAGEFASRSLRAVDRSQAVIAILGASIPKVTSKEIRRAIERAADGATVEVWVFVAAATKTDKHRQFVARIKKQFKVQIMYQPYDDLVDLQRKIFVTLLPFVIRRTLMEAGSAPVAVGGEFA